MTKVSNLRRPLVGVGVAVLSLTGAFAYSRIGNSVNAVNKPEESIVKITYGDAPGHGTGFLIEDKSGLCTVVTAAHVVPKNREILVTTSNANLFNAAEVKRAENADLAVVTFEDGGFGDCSYPTLALGDSDRLGVGDRITMTGYPERAGEDHIVAQTPGGTITYVATSPLPQGYAISYDMTSAGGMSGAPLLNTAGKVVGIHGRTDIEIVQRGRSEQSSAEQIEELEAAEVRVTASSQVYHFKWGIPIKTFVEQRSSFASENVFSQDSTVSSEGSSDPNLKTIQDLMDRADRLRKSGDYRDALEIYEEVLQLDSGNAKAWFGKGYSLNDLEQNDEALVALDKAVALDSELIWAWSNRGWLLEDLGREEDALDSYRKAISIDINEVGLDNADNWYGRGVAFLGLKRYEEALEANNKSISLDPNFNFAWNNKGYSLNNLKRYEEALEAFEEAIRLNVDAPHPRLGKGQSLAFLERYEDAIDAYDKANELNIKGPAAWSGKGDALGALAKHDEALIAYDEAIDIDPDYSSAWSGKGNAQNNLKQYQDALESLEKAISLDSENFFAWTNKGNVLSHLDQHEAAVEALDKAIDLKSDDAFTLNNKASSLRKLERYEDALEAYNDYLALEPDSAQGWFNKGLCLFRLEKYEDSIAANDKALELDFGDGGSDTAISWSNRSSALMRLGRVDEAVESAKKALDINPEDENALRIVRASRN